MRLSRCFPPATRPPDPLAGVLSSPAHHHWRLPTPVQASAQRRQGPVDRVQVPPAIARAKDAVHWQLQPQPVASTSKSTLDSPSVPSHEAANQTAEQELRDLLQALPVADAPIRVKHRKTADVQADVARSRRACLAAYSAVAKLRQVKEQSMSQMRSSSDNDKGKAPARDALLSPDLERKLAHFVGETMRLLLRLGHVHAATELDRAFFTSRKQPRSERRKRIGSRQDDEKARGGRDQTTQKNGADRVGGMLGDGLGLRRSAHQLAWMQAVTVGLGAQEMEIVNVPKRASRRRRHGGDRGGMGFLKSLEELLVEGRETGSIVGSAPAPLRADKLAFAARQMGRMQRSVRSATVSSSSPTLWHVPPAAFQAELTTWIAAIRKAECEDADEMVSIALLESGLERLEQAAWTTKRSHSNRDRTEAALLNKVEEDINRLVRSIEQDGSGRARRTPSMPYETSRPAHILALAIRFLLFRHCHSPTVTSRAASSPAADTLLPAAQLYAVLLKLPIPPSSDPALLIDVRARQTSSLFRLLDAYLDAQAHSSSRGPNAYRPVERVLDLLDLSLGRLEAYAAGNRQTCLELGVSTKTYQRILRALSEPFRPRRTSTASSRSRIAAESAPSLAFLSRALDTISRARARDAISRIGSTTSTSSGQAVFAHPKTTIHFVRAWFAAPLSTSALTSPVADPMGLNAAGPRSEDGSEIQYRLRSLLAFVDAIDAVRATPTRSMKSHAEQDGDGRVETAKQPRATLRSRKVVSRAVREIVEQRWGTVDSTLCARAESERIDDATQSAGEQDEPPVSWTEVVVERTLERWSAPDEEAESP